MGPSHVISFFRHNASVKVTNHNDDKKKIKMNEDSIISSNHILSKNKCTFMEYLNFKSSDQGSISNYQAYPSMLNKSCEQLLAAQDIKQQRQSDRRRSHGIGGAGNIRRPSEFLYADRTDETLKYKQYSTRRLSIENIFPNLRRKS